MQALGEVIVNKKAENLLKSGHLWVYGEEILETTPNIQNGDIVYIYSPKHRYLGAGFYNCTSKITVRLLSDNANDIFDKAFFARRIKYAVEYRKTVMRGDLSCTRLIFGDADMLPGLIADKFGPVLVTQTMCLGMELRKDMIFPALIDLLRADGEEISVLFERNDVAVREKEGLRQYKGYYNYTDLQTERDGINGSVEINENGIRYVVDYINGQKTGFFLDQKFNRIAAAKIAAGKNVLDCFTHTGAFALNCAAAGAKHVTAVDVSEDAVNMSRKNAALNKIQNIDFLQADVFDYLTALEKNSHKPFDYIILDPPAFTKSNATVTSAYRGYKDINLRAMRLLPRGGYLATCSCSHFMTEDLFRKMLHDAATDAKVRLKIIETRKQAKDHPILLGVPETEYLKFYIAQVI